MRYRRVFTHVNPDPDAFCSSWATIRYMLGMQEARLCFKPGHWDGSGMNHDDVAVDMNAGGRGIKGELDGDLRLSAFSTQMKNHAPANDQYAMNRVIGYVELIDSQGNQVQNMVPEDYREMIWCLGSVSLERVINSLRNTYGYGQDRRAFAVVCDILDGLLILGRKHVRAEYEDRALLRKTSQLDAFCATWATCRFAPGIEREDLRGLSYNDFSAVMTRHAPAAELRAMESLSSYIKLFEADNDITSLIPKNYWDLARNLEAVSLGNIINALSVLYDRESDVFNVVCDVLDGMLKMGLQRIKAEDEAKEKAEWFGNGKVALIRDPKFRATSGILFLQGAEIVIFVEGKNIGLIRHSNSTLRMDHPDIVAVVHAAGEEVVEPGNPSSGMWFAHESGFLFCWGTRKASAKTRSRVDPIDLARAAAALVEKEE